MIYLFQELASLHSEEFSQCLQLLPSWRKDYVLHFNQPEDQKRSAIGWLMLAYGLKKEYGIQTPPKPALSSHGKPFFQEDNMPFFNISHSGSFVGCALHSKEIGLDVQKLSVPRPSLMHRVCTLEELSFGNSPENFSRIWAMKESAVKLTGEGITGNFRDIFLLHPEIKTYALSLSGKNGFLAYSVYEPAEIPVTTVSLKMLANGI